MPNEKTLLKQLQKEIARYEVEADIETIAEAVLYENVIELIVLNIEADREEA